MDKSKEQIKQIKQVEQNEQIEQNKQIEPGRTQSLHLERRDTGLWLVDNENEMQGDLTHLKPRLKYNNLTGELLVKAAKLKGRETPVAVDATAGMGEDSLLLAAAGFKVHLYEYDAVIAALLADSMQRAAEDPELADIVSRMELHCENSIEALQNLTFIPDVAVLDPMFPERTKSASVKKKFQLIHQLEKPCEQEEELFDAAKKSGAHKIIVKRPVKGPFLADAKPSYSLSGKAVRYDVYVQA